LECDRRNPDHFLKLKTGRSFGCGTGFVIGMQGNTALIATNRHVVTAESKLASVSMMSCIIQGDENGCSVQHATTTRALFRVGRRSTEPGMIACPGAPCVRQTWA
jgi:hypothetical protein